MQLLTFIVMLAVGAALTWYLYRRSGGGGRDARSATSFYLAGRELSWYFVAGSITVTNLSSDQLVGMNGTQAALSALWELSAVAGLVILALVFVPIYYRENCTTVTELLERKYDSGNIRTFISLLFLGINVLIYIPVVLYTSALFLKAMYGLDLSVLTIAAILSVVGATYAVAGGLRAVAIADTVSGTAMLSMALLLLFLSLRAIGFDFSGIPAERLTLIGGPESQLPWPVLLTGMLFIQIFYWSTNQTLTQRALASRTVREAQKGVLVAAGIRLLIVPAIVVVPGICAYKLFGHTGDATFGRLVRELLPPWLGGAMAAVMVAGALSTYNSILNATSAIYVCDFHQRFINKSPKIRRLDLVAAVFIMSISLWLVNLYTGADSIIHFSQQMNGVFSMPILSAFVVGLLFRNVDERAMILAVLFGIGFYSVVNFAWAPIHYIHLMFITLWLCVGLALALNAVVFGRRARSVFARPPVTVEHAM